MVNSIKFRIQKAVFTFHLYFMTQESQKYKDDLTRGYLKIRVIRVIRVIRDSDKEVLEL